MGPLKLIIDGLKITPLKVIKDDRGSVMHMLRNDAVNFQGFGEVYFSTVNFGIVKGWKRHSFMTLNLAVPVGLIRIVVYDGRLNNLGKNFIQAVSLGVDNYQLLTIPPGLWYAFQGCAPGSSLLANCASIPHDPNEVENCDIDQFPLKYEWSKYCVS